MNGVSFSSHSAVRLGCLKVKFSRITNSAASCAHLVAKPITSENQARGTSMLLLFNTMLIETGPLGMDDKAYTC